MKFGLAVLVVALTGCSGQNSWAPPPTAPANTPVISNIGLLWVMVVDEGGVCLDKGTIQVLGADGPGPALPQHTPCDAWDHGGGVTLEALPAGVEARLRGAAPGYTSRDVSFMPSSGGESYSVVLIKLPRTP
jgi:hypothetical protein